MKNIITRLKFFLFSDAALDSIIKAHDRCEALEVYVQDLKFAISRLGFDPCIHGFPPDANGSQGKASPTTRQGKSK